MWSIFLLSLLDFPIYCHVQISKCHSLRQIIPNQKLVTRQFETIAPNVPNITLNTTGQFTHNVGPLLASASSGCVGKGPDTAGIKITKRLFNFGKQVHNILSANTYTPTPVGRGRTGMSPIPAAATSRLPEKLRHYLTKTTA